MAAATNSAAPEEARSSFLQRERVAFAAHRAALVRASTLRSRELAPRGTFLHGFLLPFSLIAAALRDANIRKTYLRVTAARLLALFALAALFVHRNPDEPKVSSGRPAVFVTLTPDEKTGEKHEAVKVDVPGVHVDFDPRNGKDKIEIAGQKVPVVISSAAPTEKASPRKREKTEKAEEEPAAPAPEPSRFTQLVRKATAEWALIVAILASLSAMEAFVVFLSRKYDDWLSFHVSGLTGIRPEDAEEPKPKLSFDVGWLVRKTLRRVRGYVVFAAGAPMFFPLLLVPHAGEWLFRIALAGWGWYWLGVVSAAKSAHAWADGEAAPAPAPVRVLNGTLPGHRVFVPVRTYGRLLARITRSVNAPASTFERSPAAFLGLAFARAVLALPGLYLLARPVIPVAAGRLCAESDPAARFWNDASII